MYSREIYDEVRATYGHVYIRFFLFLLTARLLPATLCWAYIYRADIYLACVDVQLGEWQRPPPDGSSGTKFPRGGSITTASSHLRARWIRKNRRGRMMMLFHVGYIRRSFCLLFICICLYFLHTCVCVCIESSLSITI